MKCQGTSRDESGETSRGLITKRFVCHPKGFRFCAVGNGSHGNILGKRLVGSELHFRKITLGPLVWTGQSKRQASQLGNDVNTSSRSSKRIEPK